MKIGLDLDDVLLDCNESLQMFHNAQYGTSLTREDITTYFLESVWKTTREESVRRVNEFVHSVYHRTALPVAGATQAVQRLQERHEIFVITSRPESVSSETHEWLGRHFPSLLRSVHHAHHFWHKEGSGTKGEICRELGINAFVDDAHHHIEEIAPVVRMALLFDAPWNRRLVLAHPNAQRVHSWDEICRALGF